MKVTILDLLNSGILDGMNFLAGRKGLNRKVVGSGILDYELDSILKDRYLHNNFHEGQFVLTTFLYAKDNEHLIGEAVKYFVEKGVSCLAIKNIYNLPIHNYVLRYADSMNFPILIMENPNIYFENLILNIDECIKRMEDFEYGQIEIDTILNTNLDNSSLENYIYKMNPSLLKHHIAIYFNFKEELDTVKFSEFRTKYRNSKFNISSSSLLRYKNGFIMIYSAEHIDKSIISKTIHEIVHALLDHSNMNLDVGVSQVHYHLYEIKLSLSESIVASLINTDRDRKFMLYNELGLYKLIFPYSKDSHMIRFSDDILKSIQDYDAEYKSSLTQTVIEYVKFSGNLSELAKTLNLHENTIRNRLGRIETITGLNFKNLEHYEQLSLAVKIHICNELLY